MFPVKKIVCPTDFSSASLQALGHATDIAVHNDAEIYLVHVISIPFAEIEPGFVNVPEYKRFFQPERRLQELAERLAARGVKAEPVIGYGSPADEIVRIASEKNADMIVIATHGNTGWRHLAFGSVAERVVRRSSCPVLSIRMSATQAPATGKST